MRIEREPLQKFPIIVAILSAILCGVGVVWWLQLGDAFNHKVDSEPLFCMGFGGLVFLACVGVMFIDRYAKLQRGIWKKRAALLNLEIHFDPRPLPVDLHAFLQFQGSIVRSTWLMGALDGVNVYLGECILRDGRDVFVRLFCLLEKEGLPVFFLRPHIAVQDKLLRMSDINFQEDEKFSRQYLLQGENETDIRQCFDASTRAWFVTRTQPFSLEVKNNLALFMIRNGSFDRLVQDARDWLRLPFGDNADSEAPRKVTS